jgi:hypothetical protein
VVLTQTKALTATETSFAILLWMNIVQLQLSLLGSNPWSMPLGPRTCCRSGLSP